MKIKKLVQCCIFLPKLTLQSKNAETGSSAEIPK